MGIGFFVRGLSYFTEMASVDCKEPQIYACKH